MPDASHYTYRVVWSEEDEEFVGTVAEFPSLSWLEETQSAALEGIVAVVGDVLEDMKGTGEEPPVPLSERTYSGKFMVRTSPRVHRALALEAQEQGVSLNMLANQKLTAAADAMSQQLRNRMVHGVSGGVGRPLVPAALRSASYNAMVAQVAQDYIKHALPRMGVPSAIPAFDVTPDLFPMIAAVDPTAAMWIQHSNDAPY